MDAACCFAKSLGRRRFWTLNTGVSAEIQMGQDPWCHTAKIQAHHHASSPVRERDSALGGREPQGGQRA